MNLSREKIILILIMMSISIGVLVYSFAYTTTTHTGNEINYLTVSDISFGLTDAVSSITLENAVPTLDKFGVNNEAFTFSITNTDTKEHDYTVSLIDQTLSTIPNGDIRYQLTKNGVVQEVKTMDENGYLDSGSLASGSSNTYSVVVWLEYDSETTEGTWEKIVKVDAGTVNFDLSGANEPVLLDNMIPVYYDDSSDVWRKADKTNSNLDYLWYNYENQMWANAVVVSETNRAAYLNDVQTPTGTEISMNDILMFYVWIPRFKYDLFASGAPNGVNVTFEKALESTGDVSCSFSSGYVQSCMGTGSYTHPAFEFDGEKLSGYWVSKFELGPESSTICYSSASTANCNISTLTLTAKPDDVTASYMNISNLFYSVRNMELSGNIYGFTNSGSTVNTDGTITDDNNKFDIHLWKPFESGALAYLTYSKYGKYGNSEFDADSKDIFDQGTYSYNEDYYGVGASTTGNIYGVYDLTGGNEFIMMNVYSNGSSGVSFQAKSSGFTEAPSKKYIEIYGGQNYGYKSLYGDAIGEFGASSKNPSLAYPFATLTTVKTLYYSVNGVTSYTANGVSTSSISGRAVITASQDIYITEW